MDLLSPPLQKQCKACTNEIQSLPDTISIFWRTHLQEVDFSDNALTELPSYIFELEVSVIFSICSLYICMSLGLLSHGNVEIEALETMVCHLPSSLQMVLLIHIVSLQPQALANVSKVELYGFIFERGAVQGKGLRMI